MYEEKTYKIEWKSVLLKIAFVVLMILIVLWLFPNNRFNSNNTENNNNVSSGKVSSLQYNQDYINNINLMKEAALNYYTVDRLPQELNASNSLTLQEMFNNKLLISFTDAEGNACDATNSFVKVTKVEENEYSMRISLTCNKQDDYLKVTIGCYDVCPNDGSCTYEKEEPNSKVQYQLKRTTGTATKTAKEYYCEAGFSLKGDKCRKANPGKIIKPVWVNGTADETYNAMFGEKTETISATATCPSGYSLNGTVCVKNTTTQVNANASCPSGYTYDGNNCTKQVVDTINANYSCPSGYSQNGNTCQKTNYETISATYTCPSGYNSNGGSCVKTVTSYVNASYRCPAGYNDNGSNCYKTTSASSSGWTYVKTYKSRTPLAEYPNSNTRYVLVSQGNVEDCTGCYTYTYYYTYKVYTKSSSCPSGYSSNGSTCVAYASKTAYCSQGYYNGSSCTVSSYQYATGSYTCPYNYTQNGTNCSRTSIVYANGSYTCPSGYNLNGTICNKTRNETINPTYTCPSGYTLTGKICYGSGTDIKNPTYTCPSGYSQNGSNCNKTVRRYFCVYDTDTLNSNNTCTRKGTAGYFKCESGTLTNDMCIVNTTYTIVNAKYTSKVISGTGTSIEYKWSDTKEEAGWEFTGKTRTVNTDEEIITK